MPADREERRDRRKRRDDGSCVQGVGRPHRVRVVNLLANSDHPVCVCDLVGFLGLAQPTVSFHMRKLVDVGMLQREQRGAWAYYSLRREALARLGEVLDPEGGTS